MTMSGVTPCVPLTNPHYWVMDHAVWVLEPHGKKQRNVRYQVGICKKCGAERLFCDYAFGKGNEDVPDKDYHYHMKNVVVDVAEVADHIM